MDKTGSSDEEAPDTVSFGSSREAALNVLKASSELSKGASHKQKRARDEKRKRRQERRDKEIKTSEDVAENLAKLDNLREKAKEALSNNLKITTTVSEGTTFKNSKTLFTEDLKKFSTKSNEELNDYIPFDKTKMPNKRTFRDIDISGTSKLRVEMVSSKKPKVLAAESVLNFRETMLYGAGSKVKRESSKTSIARKEKMKMLGKNVLCTK